MWKNKGFLALMLAAALTLGVFALAGSGNRLYIEDGLTAVPGGTVKVPVKLSLSEGLASCKIYLTADTSVFFAVPNGDGVTLEAGNVGSNIYGNTYGTAGWQVNWYQFSKDLAPGEYTFCSLPLTVSEAAAPGLYEIKVSYSQANTCNLAAEDVLLTPESGYIRILPGGPCLYAGTVDVPNMETQTDLPILISGNTGLMGLAFEITDNETVEVITDKDGNPQFTPGSAFQNGGAEGYKSGEKTKFVWYSPTENSSNGELLRLRVRIKAREGGEVPIPLSVDSANTFGAGYSPVAVRTNSPSVSVTALEILDVTALTNGSSTLVTAKLNLPADKLTGAALLCAAYKESGQMLSYAAPGSTEGKSIIFTLPKEAYAVTVFVLEKGTTVPVCEAVTITV